MVRKQRALKITVVTLFPKFVESFVESFGIVKKAVKAGLLTLSPLDLRRFGLGARQVVDDRPYGGGVGMVLRPDVLYRAIRSAGGAPRGAKKRRVVLLTPQGKRFDQRAAERLATFDELVLVCGRYEGFDERVRKFVDEEISVGDYVLMGGELPALVVSEAVMRLRPGILGKLESKERESFTESLLEYPQYTKPETFRPAGAKRALRVPKVLLTGHHRNIEAWRLKEAVRRTKRRRPDLFKTHEG